MSRELDTFKHALLVHRVASRAIAADAVDQYARSAEHIGKQLLTMVADEERGEDESYVQPLREQYSRVLGSYKSSIDKLLKAVAGRGKEPARVRAIAKQVDALFKAAFGYKWEGAKFLHGPKVEKLVKATLPLVDEAAKLLDGQKMLFAKDHG